MTSTMNRSLARHALFVGRTALAGLLATTLLVLASATLGLDASAYQSTAVWRTNPLLLRLAGGASFLGSGPALLVVALVAALPALARRQVRRVLLPLAALGTASLANSALKCSFIRVRPTSEPWPPGVFGCDQFAFPSGHAMESMALYGLLILWVTATGLRGSTLVATAGLTMVPAAAGLSRVALGVHWMSDVIGGWLAGLAVASLLVFLWEWVPARIGGSVSPPTGEERGGGAG